MTAVHLDNVSKSFGGVQVIKGISLSIQKGEFVSLLGPSGCGKTTLLRMIAGLEEANGGSIHIGGKDSTRLPPERRDIAMVFQSYALFPHMSVRDNIGFGMKLRRTPREAMDRQIAEVAEKLQIDKYLERLPKALSGGQRQRVALARALVRRPGVFLMDEPLSNLDAKLRIEARSFLTRMHQEIGVTTVYVTHDQAEAMTMGSRIIAMNNGRIQQAAPPLELYDRPANKFVAGFIGSPAMNFIDLTFTGERLIDIGLDVDVAATPAQIRQLEAYRNKRVILGVRPEHFLPTGPEGSGLTMLVEVVQHLGHEVLLDLSLGRHRCIARMHPADRTVAREQRTLYLDLDRVQFFDPDTERNILVVG